MNKFGAYLKTRSFRVTILSAIGAVIGVVLIAFFSLSFYTHHGTGVPVPKLKGLSIDRAISILKDRGFDYQIDSVYVGDALPGTVVEQDPDPETLVKENRKIYLTMVTQLAPPVALPDVVEKSFLEGSAILSNNGLKVGDTTYRADIARNVILELRLGGQILKPGTKIPKGSRLDLVLGNGNGASEVEIPDFVNRDLNEAKFAISGAGLTLGIITYQGNIADSSNLIIVAQSPAKTDSTNKVSIGTRINLTVTQGKKN